ncbi:GPALPP motifs-containing protein 1 [Paramormyrops kingsleyae]|uniref:GPALPP motifs-containing protein 1 n=1 Tax=Paramormyrops kingsleyae TaxID=1676925 RepID=UPI000CD5F91D|nr:GPALPP motifs-containing protein 1 [Paramormyrops kingsleyae]
MSEDDVLIGPALPPWIKSRTNDDSDGEVAGPALPPGYKPADDSSSSDNSEQEEQVVFKRSRPAVKQEIGDGPTSNKQRKVEESEKDERDEDEGFFGPALPPGYKKQSSPERPVLGPALPPGFLKASHVNNDDSNDEDGQVFSGPALPPDYVAEASSSDSEDDVIVGPMPAQGVACSNVAMDFELRARRMKEKLIHGDSSPKELSREAWMTELPPELQHIGLGARSFKKRSGPEDKDRSIWTDTPADRERKAQECLEKKQRGEPQEEESPRFSQKDLQMADKVSKYNESKRGESLLNMHTKKMKSKAEADANKPVERRPFDRDADLQVNRFDEAQKQTLLKKSQELNTRFSHSKDRMFL